MPNILIIDDTESSRELLGRFLRKHGYKTTYAADGREGLAAVRDSHPSLVLLDMMMPVMDGVEFLSHLRTDSATASLPVIVVSASSDPKTIRRATELGACDYLIKSKFSITTLLDRIREVLPPTMTP